MGKIMDWIEWGIIMVMGFLVVVGIIWSRGGF